MKSIIALAAFVASALAQSATVIIPAPGATVSAGAPLNITVQQEQSTSDVVQVGIAMGIQPCPNGDCGAYNPYYGGIGSVLYSGAFKPAYDQSAPPWLSLHENFTVQIPTISGPSILSIAHLELVGVNKIPAFQITNITVVAQ